MTAQEAHDLVKQGKAVLLDCREEDELRETGTAEGALWTPLSGMVEDTDEWQATKAGLPKDKTLILFCAIGGRSGRMAEILAGDGYTTVNIGGFPAWKSAGLPVVSFR